MDMLKRTLAPITDDVWAEIDQQAKEALVTSLTARKFVDVVGPKGWNYAAVEIGRLVLPPEEPQDGVGYGVHKVQPLVETRVPFDLEIAELDNHERGAKDVELAPVVTAAQKIAAFEERAVYYGFEAANIPGLFPSAEFEALALPDSPPGFLKTLAQGVLQLQKAAIEGPYALIMNSLAWNEIASASQGYPLKPRVKDLLDGELILTTAIEGACLVTARGGDFELILGHDLAVGYHHHDVHNVRLFFTESFTFRVLEPRALIRLEA